MSQENQSAYTPEELTKREIMFRIPLYQRPYAWEEQQVEQLLNDLLAAHKSQPDEHYHLGLLSVAHSLEDGLFDLIDGQQRMTTLILIGKIAADYHERWNVFCTDNRLKLYGRKEDQVFLRSGSAVPGSTVNRKMHSARECVKKFYWKKFFEGKSEDEGKAISKSFSKFIFDHAAFFLAKTPARYSPKEMNQHFVRMNNRGKQLEQHEILKVRLFGKINDLPTRPTRLTTWNHMVACLSGSGTANSGDDVQLLANILNPLHVINDPAIAKEILYSAILTIPEFLLIALSRTTGVKTESGFFVKDTLIETFETHLTHAPKIEAFLIVLEEQLASLKRFFIFIAKSGERYELRAEKEDSKDDTIDFGASDPTHTENHLITLQSYLHVSTEPHHWLPLAFDYCKDKDRIVAAEFITELERIDNQLIHERKRQISELSKDMSYNTISHYWFYRIDYELWKLYGDPTIWGKLTDAGLKAKLRDFRFRRCGSVEHINPQHGTPPNNLHSFGNLALIPSSENSKFSDYPASTKRDAIAQPDRVLYSLKMLHFLWCVADFDAVADKAKAEKAITSIGDQLFNILHGAVSAPNKACNPSSPAIV